MTNLAAPIPVHSRDSQSRRWCRIAALGVLAATTGFVTPLAISRTAAAAPPAFTDPPTRVYTAPGVNLPFAGPDAITGQTKNIVFTAEGNTSTCVVENPGDEGHSGNCIFVQIQIVQPGRGAMTIDDSAIAYATGNRSGDNTFNIGGKLPDVQAAIASLVYVPPDSEFETTDATPVTLRVDVQDAQTPSPDSTELEVDIRVEGDNAWPDLTAPQDDPYEVEVNQTFTILESQGTEVFTLTDEDAEQGDNLPPDYLLGVAWVDCGTMSFPVGSGYASYEGTPEDMLNLIGMDPTLIPGEVAGNLVLGTGWNNVAAVAWLAEIDINNDTFDDNFNQVMRWIEFHAPATAGTCTLTIVASDLGNNGMPLSGEIPFPGVDFDSVQFNVVDPNAPETTEPVVEPTTTSSTTIPEDTTTTSSSTTIPEDTTTTSSGPERTTTTTSTTTPATGGTTTTSTTTPSTGGTTTTSSTTVPDDNSTTTSSTTVPDDNSTTTSSTTVPDDDTTTTSSTTVPDDDTTTTTTTSTSTTVPDDETTTTSTTLPDESTTSTSTDSTTTTIPECPAPTTTTSTSTSSSSSTTSSTTTTDPTSTSTVTTTTTIDPCVPPPECAVTTTVAAEQETVPPTAPPTAPPTVPSTAPTTPISTSTTTTTTTTTLPIPADTTTTTPQVTTTSSTPRRTTTTIVVGIPTSTNPSTQGFRQVVDARAVSGVACITTSTLPTGGSLPPTGLSAPPGVLPVTGADATALVLLAALVALAGGALVLVRRHPE